MSSTGNQTPNRTENSAQRVVALSLAVSGVGFLIAGLFLVATVGIEWAVLVVVGLADFVLARLYATGRMSGAGRRPGGSAVGALIASRSQGGRERDASDEDASPVVAPADTPHDARAGVDPDPNPYARED